MTMTQHTGWDVSDKTVKYFSLGLALAVFIFVFLLLKYQG